MLHDPHIGQKTFQIDGNAVADRRQHHVVVFFFIKMRRQIARSALRAAALAARDDHGAAPSSCRPATMASRSRRSSWYSILDEFGIDQDAAVGAPSELIKVAADLADFAEKFGEGTGGLCRLLSAGRRQCRLQVERGHDGYARETARTDFCPRGGGVERPPLIRGNSDFEVQRCVVVSMLCPVAQGASPLPSVGGGPEKWTTATAGIRSHFTLSDRL